MAHSYGGLITGRAAADDGLDVDAVMWVGNVGDGVDHASELHLGHAELLTTRSPGDIARVEVFAGAGADAEDGGIPEFTSGVKPFHPTYSLRGLPFGPPGTVLGGVADAVSWGIENHSNYWHDPDTMKMWGKMSAGDQ